MAAITNHCINQIPKISNDTDTDTPGTFQVAGIQGIKSKNEVFDTRDLSEINLSYNIITFHVHPFLKITNEKIRQIK